MLKAFAKIQLDPARSGTVPLTIPRHDLAVWSEARNRWIVPTGRYSLMVGSSSRDIRGTASFWQREAHKHKRDSRDAQGVAAALKDGMSSQGVAGVRRQVVGPPRRTTCVEGARGYQPRGRSFEYEGPTVTHGMRWVGLNAACDIRREEIDAMAIVMGLDQHRAQITTEWIDTERGEVSRARVAPAHRESVRRFLGRFDGRELEVALEATTGWRFVVEELRRVGARVHLAEPAETSALRGNKKRA